MSNTSTDRRTFLDALADRRAYLLKTAEGLTDDQARLAPTASALTIGGLVKHVTTTERTWIRFLTEGADVFGDWAFDPAAVDWSDPGSYPPALADRVDGFCLRHDESLSAAIHAYQDVACETERVVNGLESLDEPQPLPEAPWNEPGETRTARQVLAHLIGETAQHSGHADIIRESIDGQRTCE